METDMAVYITGGLIALLILIHTITLQMMGII
jgi:hypothetical protein